MRGFSGKPDAGLFFDIRRMKLSMRIKYRVFPLLLSLLLFFLFVSCASDRILPPESESTLESLSVPTEAPLSSGTEETVSQTTASCVTEAPEPELPALSFFLDDLSKNFYVITEYESEWIPLEERYFALLDPASACDIRIRT